MSIIPDPESTTTTGIPLAPSLAPSLHNAHIHRHDVLVDRRVVYISCLALFIAGLASIVAQLLAKLIGLITNLSYYGRFSTEFSSPAGHGLGLWAVGVPVVGGVIVGLMARYGSTAIRGHGIPEAMEQILFNESRIPARVTFLKPLSAAVAIGTGGPFGAEGPIIATGGALGSLLGQILKTSAAERKTLLAAGAAAGMAATFGSPISALLLAIELLLFEFRPRSFIPVAFAATAAAGMRIWFVGSAPMFAMPAPASPGLAALFVYVLEGIVIGVAAVGVTRLLYAIEDGFEHLPVHWMWWPALGAVVVGVVGVFSPHTLGVGYDNIEHVLSGGWAVGPLLLFCLMKLISWLISLGSGTSGGTLAPLFTIGGGLGAGIGVATSTLCPWIGLDVRVAALVGMAGMFAGASRALLASIVFAFEITQQPAALLPLLGGGTAAFVVSALWMRQTIMTEKIARRGRLVPMEYHADPFEAFSVKAYASAEVVSLQESDTLVAARALLGSKQARFQHQNYPVLNESGEVVGMISRKELLEGEASTAGIIATIVKKTAIFITANKSLREALDLMEAAQVGRLIVVESEGSRRAIGILSRSDVLKVHGNNLKQYVQVKGRFPGTGG